MLTLNIIVYLLWQPTDTVNDIVIYLFLLF